jgi:hypothetical protein
MRKLLVLLAILFVSFSKSFAFQQDAVTYSSENDYGGVYVNVNTYCYGIYLSCTWSCPTSEWSYGNIQCAEYNNGTYLADNTYFFADQGTTLIRQWFSNQNYLYWGTVVLYMETYACYGSSTLTWVY